MVVMQPLVHVPASQPVLGKGVFATLLANAFNASSTSSVLGKRLIATQLLVAALLVPKKRLFTTQPLTTALATADTCL